MLNYRRLSTMETDFPIERALVESTLTGEIDALDSSSHGEIDTLNTTIISGLDTEDALMPARNTEK